MRVSLTPVLLVAFPSILAACGGGAAPGTAAPRDENLITLEEIEATQAPTAFDIIRQLRPRWMVRNRGQRTFNETEADYAKVFVDEMPPREFDFLREIPRGTIFEMRFIEPREATYLYGTGYNAGVVKVITRR